MTAANFAEITSMCVPPEPGVVSYKPLNGREDFDVPLGMLPVCGVANGLPETSSASWHH
jgi:hypothetical protein